MTYLFDFDGTLVDSMPTFAAVMTRILDENGIPYGDDLIKTVTPLGYGGTADYFITLGLKMERAQILKMMNDYAKDDYFFRIGAKENVISSLKALKEGGASLNVLTASPHLVLDACLSRLGIFELFDNVWSSDDFPMPKSDPAIYGVAAERLGVKESELLFLDDNLGACSAAKAAGARVCGVFDPSIAEYEEKMRELTDFYIRDFSELLSIKL